MLWRLFNCMSEFDFLKMKKKGKNVFLSTEIFPQNFLSFSSQSFFVSKSAFIVLKLKVCVFITGKEKNKQLKRLCHFDPQYP